MLTNGYEWKLYDFSSQQYGGIEMACVDLMHCDGDTFAFDKRSVEDRCYDMFDFHEQSYTQDYKANSEVLTDKIFSLIELGLNETVSGWNDAKAAELQKYVKSQKRATKKS